MKNVHKSNPFGRLLFFLFGIVLGFFISLNTLSSNDSHFLYRAKPTTIINIISDTLNYKQNDVVIGTPYIETKDWLSVNAGNKNFGSGMTFIFKKAGDALKLIYNGQECPNSELVTREEIPEIVLSSMCLK